MKEVLYTPGVSPSYDTAFRHNKKKRKKKKKKKAERRRRGGSIEKNDLPSPPASSISNGLFAPGKNKKEKEEGKMEKKEEKCFKSHLFVMCTRISE